MPPRRHLATLLACFALFGGCGVRGPSSAGAHCASLPSPDGAWDLAPVDRDVAALLRESDGLVCRAFAHGLIPSADYAAYLTDRLPTLMKLHAAASLHRQTGNQSATDFALRATPSFRVARAACVGLRFAGIDASNCPADPSAN